MDDNHHVKRTLYWILIKRRVRDSNSWNTYAFGSLANCWFQPLTQLSKYRIYGNAINHYKYPLSNAAEVVGLEPTRRFERPTIFKTVLLSPRWSLYFLVFVVEVRLELTCNQLPFLQGISLRGYTTMSDKHSVNSDFQLLLSS